MYKDLIKDYIFSRKFNQTFYNFIKENGESYSNEELNDFIKFNWNNLSDDVQNSILAAKQIIKQRVIRMWE